jgi:2-dehydro-3-deoxyphosphogluconate aldolase/(4S)-4-hydroxy-2-oxoglutarate aldolase
MMKQEVLQRVVDSGVVEVVRADTSEQAARIAEGCVEGGVAAVKSPSPSRAARPI